MRLNQPLWRRARCSIIAALIVALVWGMMTSISLIWIFFILAAYTPLVWSLLFDLFGTPRDDA